MPTMRLHGKTFGVFVAPAFRVGNFVWGRVAAYVSDLRRALAAAVAGG